MADAKTSHLKEIARLFFRLGVTAFGGPAAHIAMMYDEVVQRRKWIDDQHFLDLLGATSLIPGPSSTEMSIHLGYVRGGWRGLIIGGSCFIFPAVTTVLILSWLYVEFGQLPAAEWLLYGIKPVVIAIIFQALWILGSKALKGPLTMIVGLAVLGLYFLGWNELLLLLGGGILVMMIENARRLYSTSSIKNLFLPLTWGGFSILGHRFPLGAEPIPITLPTLFLTFLKIGSVLYGSGYVLLAFLRSDFVLELGWLTDKQLIDAVAIGQLTPGPLFSTATFVGYILAGFPGAILATLGIFLPSFFFVALSNPIIPKIRASPWASTLLDGVNATSLGLMAAVTIQLGIASIIDPLTILLTLLAALLLFRFKIQSTWLILIGGLTGLLTQGGTLLPWLG